MSTVSSSSSKSSSSTQSSSSSKSSTASAPTRSSASSTSTGAGTGSGAVKNGNSAADRVDVNFKPEKEEKSGVNLSAWADDSSPTAASNSDRAAELKEALGEQTLRSGSQGDDVKALQEALNERLGFKEGDEGYLEADGKFGPKTHAAVSEFQKRSEGLKQDGIFGQNTRDALLTPAEKAEAGPAVDGPPAAENGEKAEAPAQNAEEMKRLEEALGSGVMRKGSQGDNVKALQEALNQQLGLKEGDEGYLELDGKFGNGTMNAVKEFQRSKELGADGIVGNDTRNALLGREAEQVEQGAPAGPAADRYEKYTQYSELLARAIAAESRGEGYDTQVAVAQTIMNYANHKGKNLTSIVGNQNSAFLSSNKDGNKKFYSMPTSQIPNWERTLKAVDDALAGKSAVGADRIYFHDTSIGPPRWVDPGTQLALGRMRFYEER